MKRVVIQTILVVIILLGAYRAESQLQIGGGLAFGTEISNIGITANAHYLIIDPWEASASFTYFISSEDAPGVDLNLWTINFDAHYIFSGSNESFSFYPLAGLNVAGVSINYNINVPGFDRSTTTTHVGLNIGGGIVLVISDSISAVGELKYVIGNFDQLVANAGILFSL